MTLAIDIAVALAAGMVAADTVAYYLVPREQRRSHWSYQWLPGGGFVALWRSRRCGD